jgi:peptidoglycan/LPS O-acetylase OafA/YrhL
MQKEQAKVFFPGLNGLRFLAASAVIITHVELLKQQVGLSSLWDEKKHPVFFNLGGLGVYFFFVLSGFLITYLLLVEKDKTGTISIRDFYLRRIFRIWPVYYLLVFLAFFVFPHIPLLQLEYFQRFFYDHFWLKFFMFMFMLPNLALGFFHSVPHAGQAWSIGVEEQFYIIWPWVVSKSKRLVRTIIVFGILIVMVKISVLLLSAHWPANKIMQGIKEFVAMLKMECMAIGGLGACIVFQKKQKLLDLVFHPVTQLFSVLMIPFLIFFTPDKVQDGEHIIYSFFFLIIILNVALNPKSIIKLENRLFNFLGNISYGMYMYHMFIIVLMLRIAPHFTSSTSQNIYYYTASFLSTILFSALSYYLYERFFIRMKSRFSKVISGTETFTKTS